MGVGGDPIKDAAAAAHSVSDWMAYRPSSAQDMPKEVGIT